MLGTQENVAVATQSLVIASRGLVVSANPSIQQTASEALGIFAISNENSRSADDCERRMARARYEVFIIDSEITGGAMPLIQKLRAHRSSRTAVVIAIIRTEGQSSEAFSSGAQFTIQASVMRVALDRVLRAAYGMIVREQRRYFRCPIDSEFVAHRNTEAAWKGRLINISEGGFCFASPVSVTPGEFMEAQIRLPGSSIEIAANCQVQWANPNGRVGVRFLDLNNEAQSDLQHWLARQLETRFPAIASAAIRA